MQEVKDEMYLLRAEVRPVLVRAAKIVQLFERLDGSFEVVEINLDVTDRCANKVGLFGS